MKALLKKVKNLKSYIQHSMLLDFLLFQTILLKLEHIRDAIDLKRVMITVIIALMPALIYGIYNTGYQYLSQTGESFTDTDAILHGSYKIIPMIASLI